MAEKKRKKEGETEFEFVSWFRLRHSTGGLTWEKFVTLALAESLKLTYACRFRK